MVRFGSLPGLLALGLATLVIRAGGAPRVRSCDDHFCPLFSLEESVGRFRGAVEHHFAGQEDAVEVVERALMANVFSYADSLSRSSTSSTTAYLLELGGMGGRREVARSVEPDEQVGPLLLHFTGPTGVGKTLLSKLIGDALFLGDCGIKKIFLDSAFKQLDDRGRVARIDVTKKAVFDQFSRCPRSLIIFDDFQFAPADLILSFKEAFDESQPTLTYRDRTVSTGLGIFVFCSDLESEQRHLSEDMNMAQARAKVTELAGKQWRMVDQGSSFGKLFTSQGLIPFVPLSEAELRKVIRMEMGKLNGRIHRYISHYDNRTVGHKWAGHVRWNEKRLDAKLLEHLATDLAEYNARAIRNLLANHLLVHARQVSVCLMQVARRTVQRGWAWDAVALLDDVKVEDVDDNDSFTIVVSGVVCHNGDGNWGGGDRAAFSRDAPPHDPRSPGMPHRVAL